MPITILWDEDNGSVNCVALDIDEEESYDWPATVTTHPVETGGVITDQVILGNPKLVVSGYITNKPGPSNFLFYGSLVQGFEQDQTASGSYVATGLTVKNQREYGFQNVELKVPGKPLRANAAALVSAGFNALFPSVPTAQTRVVTVIKERTVGVQAWTLNTGGVDPGKRRIQAVLETLIRLRNERRRVSAMGDLLTLTDCIISGIQMPRKVDDGEGAPFTITFEQIRTVSSTETAAPTAAPSLQQTKAAGSKATEYATDYEKDTVENRLQSLDRTLLNLGLTGAV